MIQKESLNLQFQSDDPDAKADGSYWYISFPFLLNNATGLHCFETELWSNFQGHSDWPGSENKKTTKLIGS